MTKFIFVTGGVVSGLGKGITAASLGRLLKARGFKVAAQKLDPYINVDPGTMSPYQHGEVFVTEDGAETDLDLGHYERFIDEDLNKYSNLTTGKVYWNVLNKERRGEYLGLDGAGDTAYHQRDQRLRVPRRQDHGRRRGYHGDRRHYRRHRVTAVHRSGKADRHRSRQGKQSLHTRHSRTVLKRLGRTQIEVKELLGMGINPDIIVLRCDKPLEEEIFRKIALFCNVKSDCVIENRTLPILYEAPLMLEKQNFSAVVCAGTRKQRLRSCRMESARETHKVA